MKKIEVTKRSGEQFTVLVDDDYTPPYAVWIDKDGYAKVSIKKKSYFLHRLILGVTDRAIKVDHINGNKQDNTRANLRVVTVSQNAMNRKASGAHWNKRDQLWVARIWIDGKNRYIGSSKDKEEAQQMYQRAHLKAFREYSPWEEDENGNC